MNSQPLTPRWLRDEGFSGFSSLGDVRHNRSVVSRLPGVYVVYREELGRPDFLSASTGGWHKGQNPSVPMAKLIQKWVDGAHVLYIGKADAGRMGTRGISVRVDEYVRFGQGQPVGHRGGRYLWHIEDSDRLLLCWKPCEDPPGEEAKLLARFLSEYRALPFANLRGGSRRPRNGQ